MRENARKEKVEIYKSRITGIMRIARKENEGYVDDFSIKAKRKYLDQKEKT